MFTILITTFKEPRTLKKLLDHIFSQEFKQDFKVLVVAPDEESEKISSYFPKVSFIKDKGEGKPAALNLAVPKVKGDILVLTDGDVLPDKGAIQKIVDALNKNPHLGCLTARPVPLNSRDNLFGFFAHFLTFAAHKLREKNMSQGQYLDCSGYLYACRSSLFPRLPLDVLADDSFVSQKIWEKGYSIGYLSQAKVFVKFPLNFSDWLKQKRRATGGYVQKIKKEKDQAGSISKKKIKKRSFQQEVFFGLKLFFTFPKNAKEFLWLKLLYILRFYLWLDIFWHLKVKKEKNLWQRIESTK